tara:strand:+ start:864 stop:1136 length:273 start_codon:yes stop_codon:yes gene_type:complete
MLSKHFAQDASLIASPSILIRTSLNDSFLHRHVKIPEYLSKTKQPNTQIRKTKQHCQLSVFTNYQPISNAQNGGKSKTKKFCLFLRGGKD